MLTLTMRRKAPSVSSRYGLWNNYVLYIWESPLLISTLEPIACEVSLPHLGQALVYGRQARSQYRYSSLNNILIRPSFQFVLPQRRFVLTRNPAV